MSPFIGERGPLNRPIRQGKVPNTLYKTSSNKVLGECKILMEHIKLHQCRNHFTDVYFF